MNAARAAYLDISRTGLVEGRSAHELTLMLFDGALARLSTARELQPVEQREERHRLIDRTLAIVQELQASLREPERDPLAQQLFVLYTHICERLLDADQEGEDEPLEAAQALLATLRDGWAGIAPEARAA